MATTERVATQAVKMVLKVEGGKVTKTMTYQHGNRAMELADFEALGHAIAALTTGTYKSVSRVDTESVTDRVIA